MPSLTSHPNAPACPAPIFAAAEPRTGRQVPISGIPLARLAGFYMDFFIAVGGSNLFMRR